MNKTSVPYCKNVQNTHQSLTIFFIKSNKIHVLLKILVIVIVFLFLSNSEDKPTLSGRQNRETTIQS